MKIFVMLRSSHGAALARCSIRSLAKSNSQSTAIHASPHSIKLRSINSARARKPVTTAIATYKPFSTSLQRYASPYDHVDKKHEDQVEHEKLEAHPDQVSSTSSVHPIFHEQGVEEPEKDRDMLADVWSDWVSRCHLRSA